MLTSKVKCIVSFVLVFTGMLIGRVYSPSYDPNWFTQLKQAPWMPPHWVFPIAWFVIYFLLALGFWIFWKEPSKRRKDLGYIFFFIQLLINFSWSYVFFGLHYTALAFWMILVLIILVVLMMREFFRVSKCAGYIQIPYLIWLMYAFSLAGYVVNYNP